MIVFILYLYILAAPVVQVTADRTRVSLGDSVTFHCNVTNGNPNMNFYTWINLNRSFVFPMEFSSTLTIHSIDIDDIATYRCEVTINMASSVADSISIMLGGKLTTFTSSLFYLWWLWVSNSPVVPVLSARVVSPNGSMVAIGSTVNLMCELTSGDLPVSFSWTGPKGAVIQPTDTDGNISITFTTGTDYGNYTCTANNTFGMNITVLRVQEAGMHHGNSNIILCPLDLFTMLSNTIRAQS